MEIGVVSDIHGNRVALDAVLSDMPAVDGLVCSGDVVGYNPWHGACVDAMCERSVPTVMGNHDRAVVENLGGRGVAAGGLHEVVLPGRSRGTPRRRRRRARRTRALVRDDFAAGVEAHRMSAH